MLVLHPWFHRKLSWCDTVSLSVGRAYETYLQDQNPHALFSEWSIWKRCWGSVRGKRDIKVGRPGREWEWLRTAEDMVFVLVWRSELLLMEKLLKVSLEKLYFGGRGELSQLLWTLLRGSTTCYFPLEMTDWFKNCYNLMQSLLMTTTVGLTAGTHWRNWNMALLTLQVCVLKWAGMQWIQIPSWMSLLRAVTGK